MATFTRPNNHTYTGSSAERLPAGGYVIKIYDIKPMRWPSGDDYFEVSFDIAEGDYKDFFKRDYNAQTSDNKWWRGTFPLNVIKDGDSEWAINRFWDFFYAVEDSNPGFRFSGDTSDINKKNFSKKILGATFRREETRSKKDPSKTFWNTRVFHCVPTEQIRKGTFPMPKDKPLKDSVPSTPSTDPDDFVNVPAGMDEEVPFD